MKLRNKVLISIGLVWALFLIVTYLGSRFFLMQSFLTLEQNQVYKNLTRIDQSLDQVLYSLHTFTVDWAHWNGAYDFYQGKNPDFIKNNFTIPAFVNSSINYIGYFTLQGKTLAENSIDLENKKMTLRLAGLEKYIYPASALLNQSNPHKEIYGYTLLTHQIMFIAANNVTDSNKIKPSLGMLITGRFLSAKILERIATQTALHLELFLPEQIKQNASLQNSFRNITDIPSGHESQPINDNQLYGFTVIRDIDGNPIGMLRMTAPRPIFQSGLRTIRYYLVTYIFLGVLFSILMIWLLRVLIIKRLERLDQEVADISQKHALSQRVNDSGNDELSFVAAQINNMMDIIESAHEKLEQRVEERTQELKHINIKLKEEIAERKSIEKELIIHKEHLVQLAHYDALTALPNRVFFNDILSKSLHHATRHNQMLAVLFIDLDRFKKINDALGHPTGDEVLKEIARRLATITRDGDILARLGGDEFIVLLTDITNPKFISSVAEKLLHTCANPIKINAHEFFITASIGICIFPDDGDSLEDLQRNADMAMYRAKHAGGNQYQYFTSEMNIQAHEHIQMDSALRKAIQNNEFILHYQPKLNLEDGIITGVEALIRWEHPRLGMISPAKFIPHAEETGLIIQIGEWALREACHANKRWQQQGYLPISVAVNLSAKQFRHQNIDEVIATILAETKLEAKYLEVEITESAMMDNMDSAIDRLNKVKEMGVHISIDDFGTGYTSITYLKKFPVSILKIDQNFVKGIPNNTNDNAITTAIIVLAHSMGLKVVAEGVETTEQLQFLADHECDMVQGYYLSRPLPEAKIILQFARVEALDK